MSMTEKDIGDQIKVLTFQLEKIEEQCGHLKENLRQLEIKREEIKMEKETGMDNDDEEKIMSNEAKCPHEHHDEFRIIHLKDNPVDNRINSDWNHYQLLKEENKKLATRLEVIEAGHNADITRMVNEEVNYSTEIDRLKAALQVSESKRTKIIDEFKKSIKEFRDAVYWVTGCRISITATGYKVTFQYADDQNSDFLLFKTENSELKLLESEFSKKFPAFVQRYLVQHDSYPAFLAAVTLQLFSRSITE